MSSKAERTTVPTSCRARELRGPEPHAQRPGWWQGPGLPLGSAPSASPRPVRAEPGCGRPVKLCSPTVITRGAGPSGPRGLGLGQTTTAVTSRDPESHEGPGGQAALKFYEAKRHRRDGQAASAVVCGNSRVNFAELMFFGDFKEKSQKTAPVTEHACVMCSVAGEKHGTSHPQPGGTPGKGAWLPESLALGGGCRALPGAQVGRAPPSTPRVREQAHKGRRRHGGDFR